MAKTSKSDVHPIDDPDMRLKASILGISSGELDSIRDSLLMPCWPCQATGKAKCNPPCQRMREWNELEKQK